MTTRDAIILRLFFPKHAKDVGDGEFERGSPSHRTQAFPVSLRLLTSPWRILCQVVRVLFGQAREFSEHSSAQYYPKVGNSALALGLHMTVAAQPWQNPAGLLWLHASANVGFDENFDSSIIGGSAKEDESF